MDVKPFLPDRGRVPANTLRERRDRRVLEQCRVEVLRTVRRVAEEDVRALAAAAPGHRTAVALRAALDAATGSGQLVALEPLVRQARRELGVPAPDGRIVRVGDRLVSWESLGGSYRGALESAHRLLTGQRQAHAFSAPLEVHHPGPAAGQARPA